MRAPYSVTFALAALVAACAPAMRPTSRMVTPLVIPPLRKTVVQSDPLAIRFPEDAAPPSGCFALSRRSGAVACVLGRYRPGRDGGNRYLSLLSNGDEGTPNIAVRVRQSDAGPRLEQESQHVLDTLMVDGDFVALTPPVMLPPDAPRTFGKLTIELHREEIGIAPVSLWDLVVVVRADSGDPNGLVPADERAADGRVAGSAAPLLVDTMTAVACIDPSLSIRMLEPSIVLVERECRIDDGGDTEITLGAWLCDSDRARCD